MWVNSLDDKGVESRELCDLGGGSSGEVFLLVLSGLGVEVLEDEVDLVGGSALQSMTSPRVNSSYEMRENRARRKDRPCRDRT